jgi:hypothetical protein
MTSMDIIGGNRHRVEKSGMVVGIECGFGDPLCVCAYLGDFQGAGLHDPVIDPGKAHRGCGSASVRRCMGGVKSDSSSTLLRSSRLEVAVVGAWSYCQLRNGDLLPALDGLILS